MNPAELLAEYGDHVFDEIDLDITKESLVGFATACGEAHPRFIDSEHADFQGVPNYLTRVHGTRSLPEGFPVEMHRCFDAGKSIEVHQAVRAGDEAANSVKGGDSWHVRNTIFRPSGDRHGTVQPTGGGAFLDFFLFFFAIITTKIAASDPRLQHFVTCMRIYWPCCCCCCCCGIRTMLPPPDIITI